jgi:GntR family transcriptional regulator
VGDVVPRIGPAAERIRRQLLDQIHGGLVTPGQRLGAERDLAQELGVSRSTVRQALAALEEADEVRRVPGRGGGTFVRSRKVERDLSKVVGVPALLRSQGMTSGSRVISTGIVTPDAATATALHLRADELVVDIVRIRLADGTPISLEHVRLPAERFPRLLDQPLGGRSTSCSRSATTPFLGRRRSTSR